MHVTCTVEFESFENNANQTFKKMESKASFRISMENCGNKKCTSTPSCNARSSTFKIENWNRLLGEWGKQCVKALCFDRALLI